jgi:hypothetical protein
MQPAALHHGQHTVGALLDANDATLKAALGELVEAATWWGLYTLNAADP